MATVAQRLAARNANAPAPLAIPSVLPTTPVLVLNEPVTPSQPQQPTNAELYKMLKIVIDNQHNLGHAINKIHQEAHAINVKFDHAQKAPNGLLWRIFENVCGVESMLLYIPED